MAEASKCKFLAYGRSVDFEQVSAIQWYPKEIFDPGDVTRRHAQKLISLFRTPVIRIICFPRAYFV